MVLAMTHSMAYCPGGDHDGPRSSNQVVPRSLKSGIVVAYLNRIEQGGRIVIMS
jgi:hypothetical protein